MDWNRYSHGGDGRGKTNRGLRACQKHGKTPAKSLTNRVRLEITQGLPDYATENSGFGEPSRGLCAPQGEFDMIPVMLSGLRDETRDAFIKAVLTGAMRAYVHGRLEYEDIFEKPHWLTFCHYYDPASKNFKAYREHNDTDND